MATIQHRHDRHGILWQTWTGVISMEELVAQAHSPVTPETDSPIKCAVTDFRAGTLAVAPAEVWRLVESFAEQPERRRGWRWAVLADKPDHVGLATLFQHRGRSITMDVEVFATEEAAVAWLLEPRNPDSDA